MHAGWFRKKSGRFNKNGFTDPSKFVIIRQADERAEFLGSFQKAGWMQAGNFPTIRFHSGGYRRGVDRAGGPANEVGGFSAN